MAMATVEGDLFWGDFKGFHHGNLGLTMDLTMDFSISGGISMDLCDYEYKPGFCT